MNSKPIAAIVFAAWSALAGVRLASAGTEEQLIQIQTTVQVLQDNMARMQQSFDEQMGVMKDLMTQQTNNVNRMSGTVNTLQKSLLQQEHNAGDPIDQVSGQVQALHDSVDELKARLENVSKQLNDIQTAGENNIANPPGGGVKTGSAIPNPTSAAASPEVLYNSALGDYNTGKDDLAAQEFSQFLQVYPNNSLAGSAQFYLGESEYRRNNFAVAIQDYNTFLDHYPEGGKGAAAQLKKAFALLELEQKDDGVKELRRLIARYPNSLEATQAKNRLKNMGVTATGRIPRSFPRHP
jgi:tol-pal system protein YbgF